MTKKRTDITIVGGGLIGLCLAPILAQLNFKIILVDKENIIKKKSMEKDSRTVAISQGTKVFLEKYNIWRDLYKYTQPIDRIQVLNRNVESNINFSHSVEMGYIIEHKNFKKILLKKIKSQRNIKILNNKKIFKINNSNNFISTFLKDDLEINSKLLIGADGKNSFLRSYYKIPFYQINYNQSALVMNFNHFKNHFNTAYEIFLPNGPLATLPMKNYSKKNFKSSLIWSEKSSYINRLLSLEKSVLKDIIEEKISKHLGKINSIESVKKFPLSAHICRKFYDERVVLLGDSAHSIHPIAGQGWNLGMRDVKNLIEFLQDSKNYGLDFGSKLFLKEYNDYRFTDVSSMLFITHNLNKIFSSKSNFINKIRSIGFDYINNKEKINKSLVDYAMGINL
tara:strand:+ start:2899 stop:4083 length:1185 start_codon:yes stop_codon:yes gene_type:complete